MLLSISITAILLTVVVMGQTAEKKLPDVPDLLNLDKFLNDTDSDVRDFTTLLKKHRHRFRVSHRDEFNRRLGHWRNAKKSVEKFRGRFRKAKFRLNKFALMSKEEHKKYFGVILPKDFSAPPKVKRSAFDTNWDAIAPDSFDFRSHGKITPIKNQGSCGSCWAFTVAATVEAQFLLRFNQSLDLSEQSLVNCNSGAWGCNGGNVVQTMAFVQKSGIASESCLPYTTADGTCTAQCDAQKYYIGGYNHFGYDESKFAQMLYNYGPAAVTMYVPPEFMYYDSGILDLPNEECIEKNEGLHAMTIVGYTPEYWIIKNSWDSDWGEDGYVRVKRGINFCSMTMEVAAPYLNSTIPPTTGAPTRATPPSAPTPAPTAPSTRATPPPTVPTNKPTTRVIPTPPTTPSTTRPTPPPTPPPRPFTTPTTTTITPRTITPTRKPPTPTLGGPIIRTNCPAGDGTRMMDDAKRTHALNSVNGKRSELARGKLKMSNGNFVPVGQNIRKLTYNCTLEAYAQQYANTCTKPNVPDTHMILLAFPYRASINDAVTQIIRHSFAFPNDYRVINENRLNNVYANNAEFAYDQAMSIGCGYSNNPCFTESTKTVIACGITPLKHTGAPTFTIGCSPCKEDRDCNKTNYNKCDTSLGLCYA